MVLHSVLVKTMLLCLLVIIVLLVVLSSINVLELIKEQYYPALKALYVNAVQTRSVQKAILNLLVLSLINLTL